MTDNTFSGDTVTGYLINDRYTCLDCISQAVNGEDDLSNQLQADTAETFWNRELDAMVKCDFCQCNLVEKMFGSNPLNVRFYDCPNCQDTGCYQCTEVRFD